MLDPTKTGVAAPSNPGTAEGSPSTSTLENLDANIAAELNPPTDTSTGVAPVATTQAPEGTPTAGEPTVEEKSAEATAKAERLNQDNANLRALVNKLGVDPDSQTAEHLRLGLVTVEDVVRAKQPATPVAAPQTEPVAPVVSLDQKLVSLQNALGTQTGEVSEAQYRDTQGKMLEVIADLVQANQNTVKNREIDQNNRKVQDMIGAANEVFVKEVATHVPEAMQDIASEMFLGAADIEHAEVMKQFGPKANTPEQFKNAAAKVAPRFNEFIQTVFKAGGQAVTDAINKANPAGSPIPNPLQPGTTGGGTPPAPAPKNKFDLSNLDANVDEQMALTAPQI